MIWIFLCCCLGVALVWEILALKQIDLKTLPLPAPQNVFLYWLLSLTWGLPMTLIGFVGAAIALVCGLRPKVWGWNIQFEWAAGGGLNLGPIQFVSSIGKDSEHEHGHGIQNIYFGPFMPFIVGIPSIVRAGWRELQRKCGCPPKKPYDAIWFEGNATVTGKYFNETKRRG